MFSLGKGHLNVRNAEKLTPVVFGGANTSLKARRNPKNIFGKPTAARKFGE